MADESAFLAALQANPADDTARLVYADWLDEHDQPDKAEYLRLVASLVHGCEDCTADQAVPARVIALAGQLDLSWRAAAGSRFAVVLYGYDVAHKISAIKAIREITGQGLAEAKATSEALPARIFGCCTFEQAVGARDHLRDNRPIRVQIHPCDQNELPHTVVFKLSVSLHAARNRGRRILREARAAFAAFLVTAAGRTPDDADRLAEADVVVLEDGLEMPAAGERLRFYRALLHPGDPPTHWYLWLRLEHTVLPRPTPA